MGNSKWAALACKHIIVSCEEIVDHDVIRFSPHNTLIPGFRVDAVVEEHWGAHPSELLGYYNFDLNFRAGFYITNANPQALQDFIKEYIYDLQDRHEYIQHIIGKTGSERLSRLRARRRPSSTADYGTANLNVWDDKDYSYELGVTKQEFYKILEEQAEVIEWETE